MHAEPRVRDDGEAAFDLSRPRRMHVVAVGGAGMSAIAVLLAEAGHLVTGSDAVRGPNFAALESAGVTVEVGHRASAVRGVDAVLVSTAVPPDNPEVLEATRAGIPVMNRRRFLPALAAMQPFLSVGGTHGKTTTSSMLAAAMRGGGEDVSWLVGAPVRSLGAAAHHGSGRFIVLEADESDASFLAGPRSGAIVTNIEADHLEFWGGMDALNAGYAEFVADTDGPAVVCGDDPGSAALGVPVPIRDRIITYGTDASFDYVMVGLTTTVKGSRFTLRTPRGPYPVHLALPGHHNALNATAALALAAEVGADLEPAIEALGVHAGVYRRFERRGSVGGVDVIDDYAHLPTEVSAALRAAADMEPARLVVVFQPHRYSRTEALWADFATCFDAADVLVLTEVYAAGEQPREGVSGHLIVDAVNERGATTPLWADTLSGVAEMLSGILRDGDLLMTVGAGDVREVGDMVLRSQGDHE